MGRVVRKKSPAQAEIQQRAMAAEFDRTDGAYTKQYAGRTADSARGTQANLYRQTRIERKKVSLQGRRGWKYEYNRVYDEGWDDYNRVMREMRFRVAEGATSLKAADHRQQVNRFGGGQSRTKKRRASLIGMQED